MNKEKIIAEMLLIYGRLLTNDIKGAEDRLCHLIAAVMTCKNL